MPGGSRNEPGSSMKLAHGYQIKFGPYLDNEPLANLTHRPYKNRIVNGLNFLRTQSKAHTYERHVRKFMENPWIGNQGKIDFKATKPYRIIRYEELSIQNKWVNHTSFFPIFKTSIVHPQVHHLPH